MIGVLPFWRATRRTSIAVISGTETQLWRLGPNSEFEDVNGQGFRKTGATMFGLWFDKEA